MLCSPTQIHLTLDSQKPKRRTSIVSRFLKRKEEELLRKAPTKRGKRRKCAQEKNAFPLLMLPGEIIVHVISFLDFSAALACCISKQLYTIINETNWLWKALFETRYLYFVGTLSAYEPLKKLRQGAKKINVDWKQECARRTKIDRNWKQGIFTESIFKGHMDWVRCLQFDGDKMFSGSADKAIKVCPPLQNSHAHVYLQPFILDMGY
jgi:hypothetical protein